MARRKKMLKSQVEFENSIPERVVKSLTLFFGSVAFLVGFLCLVIMWIAFNYVFTYISFDPYPFVILFMILQLFVVFFSILVLISQNKEVRTQNIRDQIDLEVNVRAEEVTRKVLRMLEEVEAKLGIIKRDVELEELKQETDLQEIKEVVEEKLDEDRKT